MIKYWVKSIIKYIQTHSLLTFIVILSVISGTVVVIISANKQSDDIPSEPADKPQTAILANKDPLEHCLTSIGITDLTERYKQQIICYKSYDPSNSEIERLQNKINALSTDENTVENAPKAQNQRASLDIPIQTPAENHYQESQTPSTPTIDTPEGTNEEHERLVQCEMYKQQYGDKTPEELAQEDSEILAIKKELEVVVLDLNRGHPDWVSDPEEKEYWLQYNIEAEARFLEVQARARELMKNKIDYYTQLGSVCH